MSKITWDPHETDAQIMDGEVLAIVANTTSSQLQTIVEFISGVIGFKLDFRVGAGRYYVMCKSADYPEVVKSWKKLGDIVATLCAVHKGVVTA